MTTSSMFCLEYLGRRANSAAIQPRLRVILRITSARCVSVQSGNARRRLNSAVLRNFGDRRKRTCATKAASDRAISRGKTSRIFNDTRTTAYSAHSFIAFLRRRPPLPRQYACRRGYIAMYIAHDVRLTSLVSFSNERYRTSSGEKIRRRFLRRCSFSPLFFTRHSLSGYVLSQVQLGCAHSSDAVRVLLQPSRGFWVHRA